MWKAMTPESTSHPPPSLYFPWIASAIAIIVASLVLVGWLLDIALLKSVLPGAATMKPNTAVCFVLSGLALWLLCPAPGQAGGGMRPVVALACVTLVAGVGLLTLGEYGLNLNIGIDELLFRETLTATQLPSPGRMAPATALDFLLLGLSLTWLDAESRHGHRPSQYMALGVILVGLLALLGYLYGVPALYRIFAYESTALHTPLLFLVLGGGALWARPDCGLMATVTSDHTGSWMARRILPVAISLPIVIGWLRWGGERIGLYETAFGLALFVMSNVVILT